MRLKLRQKMFISPELQKKVRREIKKRNTVALALTPVQAVAKLGDNAKTAVVNAGKSLGKKETWKNAGTKLGNFGKKVGKKVFLNSFDGRALVQDAEAGIHSLNYRGRKQQAAVKELESRIEKAKTTGDKKRLKQLEEVRRILDEKFNPKKKKTAIERAELEARKASHQTNTGSSRKFRNERNKGEQRKQSQKPISKEQQQIREKAEDEAKRLLKTTRVEKKSVFGKLWNSVQEDAGTPEWHRFKYNQLANDELIDRFKRIHGNRGLNIIKVSRTMQRGGNIVKAVGDVVPKTAALIAAGEQVGKLKKATGSDYVKRVQGWQTKPLVNLADEARLIRTVALANPAVAAGALGGADRAINAVGSGIHHAINASTQQVGNVMLTTAGPSIAPLVSVVNHVGNGVGRVAENTLAGYTIGGHWKGATALDSGLVSAFGLNPEAAKKVTEIAITGTNKHSIGTAADETIFARPGNFLYNSERRILPTRSGKKTATYNKGLPVFGRGRMYVDKKIIDGTEQKVLVSRNKYSPFNPKVARRMAEGFDRKRQSVISANKRVKESIADTFNKSMYNIGRGVGYVKRGISLPRMRLRQPQLIGELQIA